MKVKPYKYNARTFYAVVDDMDCPVNPYASAYINRTLLYGSENTSKRYVYDLVYTLKFFNNLAERIASGDIPSIKEYSDFYNYCSYKTSINQSENIAFLRGIESKRFRNIMAANKRIDLLVENQTIQGRIRQFRLYLTWLFNNFHNASSVPGLILEAYDQLVCKIKLDEEGLNRNRSKETVGHDESSIPDDVFVKLMEMILPSSPNNPFSSSKVRNYLIVSTLIQSGIRRGALCKIKISDCLFHGSYDTIKIFRGGADPTDPRINRPNQKTKNHLVVVDTELLKQYKFYIDTIRSSFPKSVHHDFVFVSEKNSKGTSGNPLSLNSVNRIFAVLSEALDFRVHPHLCRHKWNELFDDAGRASGLDSNLIEDVRKYAMGWTANSSMNQTYNDKKLHEKAREVHSERQKRIDDQ